jgi:NADH:ubiquinone oxidoreductase subunit 3 (subunit A)
MIYLLIIIIILLGYIAFFTPERRREREIKRVQKIFNNSAPELPFFKIDDPRNETYPDEMVRYESANGERGISHRKLAVMFYRIEEKLKNSDDL